MKALKIATVLPLLLLVAGALMAQTQYGEAVIQQGSMTIVRGGKSLNFDKPNTPIQVIEEDLLRVRPASRVELRSREKATITLGANAVFHVKPWQSRGKTGFIRALFGRFRSSVVGLVGGEQFNVKTATATIGVKGTEKLVQVTNRGGALLIVTDGVVGFQGQVGIEIDLNKGTISLIVGANPPTPPVPLPPELEEQLNELALDSPPANSQEAQNFAGEQILIDEGIIDSLVLEANKGQGETQTQQQQQRSPEKQKPPKANANEGSKALQRARVPLQFSQ